MKKIFTVMVLSGLLLAAATAGGVDMGTLSITRVLLQGSIASFLMLMGACFMNRGEWA